MPLYDNPEPPKQESEADKKEQQIRREQENILSKLMKGEKNEERKAKGVKSELGSDNAGTDQDNQASDGLEKADAKKTAGKGKKGRPKVISKNKEKSSKAALGKEGKKHKKHKKHKDKDRGGGEKEDKKKKAKKSKKHKKDKRSLSP